MMIDKQSIYKAALFSSLISGPVFWFGHYIFYPESLGSSPWWALFLGPLYWQIFTYPVSLIGLILLGIPLHLGLLYINVKSPVVIGALGGPIVFLIAVVGMESPDFDYMEFLFIACGASVSTLYAFLYQKFNRVRAGI